ncbi:hypothetical protein [Streptomyces sp. NPDC046371]|uniref:hypothetical protein n=1 Tax=Streptomyces sp. NPDC046371 TaxID=3154916 RepID=UPI0033FCDB0E
MAELNEAQRHQRRTQARKAIETAIANTPDAQTATPAELADIALDALGDLAADILVDGTMMRSLNIKDGVATLELEPATEILKIFVASMRGVLDGYGAENYVEAEMEAPSVSMDLRDGDNPTDSYTVTIQRRTRPTPHEFRLKAEENLATVMGVLAHWIDQLVDGALVDVDDLTRALARAGHPLPGDYPGGA